VQLIAARVAADSTRCMGLWAHCTCLSTMPPRERYANAWKRTN